jgi:roadblock/LC7 domain-containing protein
MLEYPSGKLVVYASSFTSHEKRLKSVSVAAEKMARLLKLSFEIVTFGEKITPIYVYYKNGDEESIPIYCDKGEKANIQEIYTALRNMMFVLSFHPKHSALRQIRKGIMQFS